ncbi:MAG: cytidylate kinase [Nitrospirae bacterium GWF2_44_13]|nr:MAG: cytidylate kinase [Nitrospirae bacterium GWF2_44_13]OGW63732.1 MAG: cytidylate kinase [Nitrospirae bacterium RIFOXYA2_FULL_44_9]OGW72942.1 MAG: cytidylate kinase [Nitrospirae bacterium RIFOXYC2_FULL_44_7]
MGKVIAIDGPSGAGKGTIAKLLAGKLGFSYLDTGALYRAVALALREKGINPEDRDEKLKNTLSVTDVSFKNGTIFLNGRDVSEEIRTTEIGHYSSVFSARKIVRDFLLEIQRNASLNADLVAEGRDMTTVVFPDAWKKFYLDASVEERAKRRYLQLKEKGINITESEARKDVVERDARDSGRDIAPLRKADDAALIDSSSITIDEVLENIMKVVRTSH